jgi:hypothetical protein
MGLRVLAGRAAGRSAISSLVSTSFLLTAAAVLGRTRQAAADAGGLVWMCGTPQLGPRHRTGSGFSRALTGITLAVRSFLPMAIIWIFYAVFWSSGRDLRVRRLVG